MRTLLTLSATTPFIATAFIMGGAVALATELPSYELLGFPIAPHQLSVMGAANIQERSPTPSLMLGGMPASLHQVVVLTPRPGMTEQQVTDKLVRVSPTE